MSQTDLPINTSRPSRPTYVRLELTKHHDRAPETLVQLTGKEFRSSHDTIIRFFDNDTITQPSYRKACQINKSTTPGNTFVCHCSFTPTPCHKCHSAPIPAGTSISHGDWNWERICRRRIPATGSSSTWDNPSIRDTVIIDDGSYGRWSDETLSSYQTKTIRDPNQRWNYTLMSLWNVEQLSDIPMDKSNYKTHLTPTLEFISLELGLFKNPDTRFLEWVVRNEI